MAYDLALDPETGDILFGPTRDLMGVTGAELNAQRISVRLKIPRGTFTYDLDGTLGSFLHEVSRSPSEVNLRKAHNFIEEALSDMEGISIDTINLKSDSDKRVLVAEISFSEAEGLFQDAENPLQDESPLFDARVLITPTD